MAKLELFFFLDLHGVGPVGSPNFVQEIAHKHIPTPIGSSLALLLKKCLDFD